jgi:hypothetical protein
MTNEFEEEENIMKLAHLHSISFICILAALAALAGCAGKSNLPVYPVDALPAESAMKPYKVEKAEFSLPPGWIFKPQDPNKPLITGINMSGQGLVGVLKKESDGGGGSLVLSCWGAFIRVDIQPKISREMVTDNIPDAVLVKSFQVETPGSYPQVEIYSGTRIVEGKKVNILGYAAWKWTYGFGCKYGISGFAPPAGSEQFEKELVAILRSLKS